MFIPPPEPKLLNHYNLLWVSYGKHTKFKLYNNCGMCADGEIWKGLKFVGYADAI
jgi:hypothetical protein